MNFICRSCNIFVILILWSYNYIILYIVFYDQFVDLYLPD